MKNHGKTFGLPHPRFRVLWPDAGGLAMFAEFAQFLVDLPDARLLHPSAGVDPTTLEPERRERLRANLDTLVARGFWITGDAEGDPTVYATPDFDAAPRVLDDLGPDGQWVSLADPREDPQIAMLAAESLSRRPSPRSWSMTRWTRDSTR